MRHSYKKIVAYNPVKSEVTSCKLVPESALFNGKAVERIFWEVYDGTDTKENLVIGVSITNDLYQIAPTSYDKYIKEDGNTVKHIDKSKFLVACSKYQTKHNLWSNEYD